MCGTPLSFVWTIDPYKVGGGRLGNLAHYCLTHFLDQASKAISDYAFPLVITEPLDLPDTPQSNSQWVFYTPDELKVDNFSAEDQDRLMGYFSQLADTKHLVWLPGSSTGPITTAPLFKNSAYEILPIDAVKSRLYSMFSRYTQFSKGSFHTNLPHTSGGILLYTNYF